MNQNDSITTTSFSSNGRQVANNSQMRRSQRDIGSARCARCERGGTSCWCGAISSSIIVILTLVCIYLLYLVVFNNGGAGREIPVASKQISAEEVKQPGTLKLVSVFSRHGDRAPTSGLPRGDNMADKVAEFWPRGLENLTDSGRFRMYRLGLELRRRYARHLDFDASHFLAFSSRHFRCKESLELTLRGLFQLDWTSSEGRELASELAQNSTSSRLPGGSGSPLEYKQVAIDAQTVPSLSFGPKRFPCKYQQEHASLVWNYDPQGKTSKMIRDFKGVAGLEKLISDKYLAGASASLADLNDVCGTVKCELQLRRTSASAAYGRHYIDWVNKRAPEFTRANVSLFDLCDQTTALFFDKSLEGTSERLQLGPLITSLITSQEAVLQVPLGEKSDQPRNGITFDSRGLYAPPSPTQTGRENTKRIVLYSTHDSVIQPLLYRLGIGRPVASGDEYEAKFAKWSRPGTSLASKFLAGFGSSEFGISLAVELYEMPTGAANNNSQTTAAYVQVALYNEEDPKYKPVEYHRLEFGRICRQLFGEQHPNSSSSADSFFKQPIFESTPPFDEILSCPFDLFKNVTSHYLISTPEFNKLCAI